MVATLDSVQPARITDLQTARITQLLRACHDVRDPRHGALAAEVERVNAGKAWAAEELIALSVKIAPGRLSRNRYDSALHYEPQEACRLAGSVLAAAPSAALAHYLAEAGNPVLRWVNASSRTFSYLAVEHDARVYKIYLFDPKTQLLLEDADASAPLEALRPLSYIDLIEMDMDVPQRQQGPMYFRLRADFDEVLEPAYRPNAGLAPQLLQIPRRDEVVAQVRRLIAGVGRIAAPVVKCRLPPAAPPGRDRLCDSSYAASMNTFAPECVKYLEDHTSEIGALGELFGCAAEVAQWLCAAAPFDCFISYVCVGPDFVTLYYKSTNLVRRVPTRFVRHRWAPAPPAARSFPARP